ncbi:MAG: thioredoxin family protein [Aeropyrum sp.]|nr:thioredoxin family protein [Aeropyrum sp.]MCE4615859.1 thioredoxin family protein [Aeropyrum sp.]
MEDEELREILKRKAARIIAESETCCRVKLGEGVYDIVEPSELKEIVESCRAVFAFFYTPNCPYCRALKPVFEEVALYFRGRAAFVSANLARFPFMSEALGILGTPTIIVFVGGREAGRLAGLVPPERLEMIVRDVVEKVGC